jgi:hypothetical protein
MMIVKKIPSETSENSLKWEFDLYLRRMSVSPIKTKTILNIHILAVSVTVSGMINLVVLLSHRIIFWRVHILKTRPIPTNIIPIMKSFV